MNQRPSILAERSLVALKALRHEINTDGRRHGPWIQDVVVKYDQNAFEMMVLYEEFALRPSVSGWSKARFQTGDMSVRRLQSAYHTSLYRRLQNAMFIGTPGISLPQYPPLAAMV